VALIRHASGIRLLPDEPLAVLLFCIAKEKSCFGKRVRKAGAYDSRKDDFKSCWLNRLKALSSTGFTSIDCGQMTVHVIFFTFYVRTIAYIGLET
jgi:hypothetical protein